MIKVTQTNRTINMAGYVDRVEKVYSVKHEHVNYQHINHPILVASPKIEDYDNLVVVHDAVEVVV